MAKTMYQISIAALILVLTHLGALPLGAAGPELSGYIAVEGRFFIEDPLFTEQSDDPQISLVVEPELRYSHSRGEHQLTLIPFLRLDSLDDERSHTDLREGYWRYSKGDWRLLLGLNKVFWGVTESQHLVDVINQSDVLEDIDLEAKLGQPMILIGTDRDWGELEFYLMPYFRKRQYPGEEGRLRAPLIIDDPGYESGAEEYHPDMALRYSHYFGDWDIGLSYFYGTSREPVFMPSDTGETLIPLYGLIHQAGIDLQYTYEAWLWKFETIVRDSDVHTFGAAVGGFEYTFFQVAGSKADLGLLLEYNWDGRDEESDPATIFNNDIFIGSRLAMNDIHDSTALFGAIIDLEDGTTLISLEAERRFGQSWIIELTGRFFAGVSEQDPLASFENDSFVNLSIQYHF